jgi:hypothetical protein
MDSRACRLIAPATKSRLLLAALAATLSWTQDARAQSESGYAPRPAFHCTFSRTPADCGFFQQAKSPARAMLLPLGRERGYAVRLLTEPGDSNVYGSGKAERSDLALTPEATDCTQGREAWWAHSVMFPDDYVAPPAGGWGVVFDFHHTGLTGQANFHVDAAPEPVGLRLRGYGGPKVDGGHYEVVLGPVRRNVWYDFVYHVRWSSGQDGWFRAWVNGVKRLDHRGPTLYAGQGCYLKLANYHSAFGRASSVIHDRIVRGAIAEAVALTPLEGVAPLQASR